VIALLLVAISVGLSNFAAAIGIGVSGVTARVRLEVGAVFGIFEATMPVLGLLLGHRLASDLGSKTRWIGGGLLIATGLYGLYQAGRAKNAEAKAQTTVQRRGRLLASGLALSVDNLVIGFALGTYHVELALAAVVIGSVSIALSFIGLELGSRIGTRIGQRGEVLGSVVLILVGVGVATGAF
jgi:manganese efflux pump family protein